MWKQLQAVAFRYCPFAYLCISLPIVIFQVFVVPPFQGADEYAHFLRVVHLARGNLVGERIDERASGGPVDRAATQALPPFLPMIGRPDIKLDGPSLGETRNLSWSREDQPVSVFPTSVIYPPFMYLPAIIGVTIGQYTKKSVLDTIYLARFLSALTAIALSTWALALAGPGRTAIFTLLCFPMTLHLYSYITQDGMMISLAALIAGACSRACATQKKPGLSTGLLLAGAMGCIAAARPPMLPLAGIFLLPMFSGQWLNGAPRWFTDRRVLYLAFSASVALAWVLLGASPVKVPFRPEDGVSISGQIQFLMGHLAEIPLIAARTLATYGRGYIAQIVGQLGHLDTPLPRWYYLLAVIPVIAAILADSMRPQNGMRPVSSALILGLAAIAAAGVFAIQYLSWTVVGTRHIDGVQGRYFIPILMFCAICIPCRPRPTERGDGVVAALGFGAWVAVYGFAAYGLFLIPRVILGRFIG